MAHFKSNESVRIDGPLQINPAQLTPPLPRTNLLQQDLEQFTVKLTDFRIWDAIETNLPGTSATDDLSISDNTFATGVPDIRTSDLKAAGATSRYARVLIQMPPNYVASETVQIRVRGGMITTIADNTATVDLEVYKSDEEAAVDGADLCSTAATTINSLTYADVDFTITDASLSPGDILDVRLHLAVNDAAEATAVIASIGSVKLLCDTRG